MNICVSKKHVSEVPKMVKKVCFLLAVVMMVALCSIPAFAGSDNSTYDADTKATKEKFITITKPEEGKAVITYSKSYTISGVTKTDDVVIELYRLNEEKKQYEKLTIEEKNSWVIEKSGITFAKETELKEGSNVIMLVSHKASDDKDKQRSIFDIRREKQNLMDKIKDKILDIFDKKQGT